MRVKYRLLYELFIDIFVFLKNILELEGFFNLVFYYDFKRISLL